MADQKGYRNVLCVRADNMGDVIMATPAFRALKETFGSSITLLTSKAGAIVAPHMDCIDDVIAFDLPWVKSTGPDPNELVLLAEILKRKKLRCGDHLYGIQPKRATGGTAHLHGWHPGAGGLRA
jgi:hypothetical protein